MAYFAIGLSSSGDFRQKVFLACASFFFYGYWNVMYVPLLVGSILVNFGVARQLAASDRQKNYGRTWLVFGVIFNIGLLCYFKYMDFLIESINYVSGSSISVMHIVLPLAISFFTFQQIAYLVDSRRGVVSSSHFWDYLVFVTFFPQLIAGPIVHHVEMMPQFMDAMKKRIDWNNMSMGVYLFSLGLFKKVMIADRLSVWVNAGYSDIGGLNLISSWAVTLAYTFQIYFDFSGYMDMAHGCARMFNITLPNNFDSPYKSLGIQDFWRRWHITLGRFLRDYLYIPLGGGRGSSVKTIRNVLITFFLGGIWHGAGWTFVIWGSLHGIGLVVQRLWRTVGVSIPKYLSWFMTFLFVHFAWVFFRAVEVGDAWSIVRTMFGLEDVVSPFVANPLAGVGGIAVLCTLLVCFVLVLFFGNSHKMGDSFVAEPKRLVYSAGIFTVSLLHLNTVTEFIYFQF
jgi:D-alanyl-lipoteichoic acid acyltransferase DltB (MBOAT superfamily)